MDLTKLPNHLQEKLSETVVLKWLYGIPMTMDEARLWSSLLETQAPIIQPVNQDEYHQWADSVKAMLQRVYINAK